jgi:hypothetical protein
MHDAIALHCRVRPAKGDYDADRLNPEDAVVLVLGMFMVNALVVARLCSMFREWRVIREAHGIWANGLVQGLGLVSTILVGFSPTVVMILGLFGLILWAEAQWQHDQIIFAEYAAARP